MSDGRINAPHLVVGFGFLLLGVFLFLDRLGVVDFAQALAYWPLLLVLLGLSLMVQASRPPGSGRSDFPAGPLIILVLITLVAGRVLDSPGAAGQAPDAPSDVRLTAILSGRRAAVTDTFRAADLTSVMGGTVLDLRQATIPPGETGVVDVFTMMGGAVLHVPAHWVVDVQSTVVMGGVKDDRNRPAGEDEDRDGRRPRRGGESRQGAGESGTESRRGDQALPEIPEPSELPDLPALPDVPVLPEPPDSPEPSPAAGAAAREDASGPSTSPPPRIVVRGFVMMGGVTIKP